MTNLFWTKGKNTTTTTAKANIKLLPSAGYRTRELSHLSLMRYLYLSIYLSIYRSQTIQLMQYSGSKHK